MDRDSRADKKVALSVIEFQIALRRSKMFHGAQEEHLCDAIRVLYVSMLCTYQIDRNAAIASMLLNIEDEVNESVREKIVQRVNAFERDLLDKPF